MNVYENKFCLPEKITVEIFIVLWVLRSQRVIFKKKVCVFRDAFTNLVIFEPIFMKS